MNNFKNPVFALLGVLMIASLLLTSCATQQATPEVRTVIETVVVTEPGEETVKIETVVVTVEPELPEAPAQPKVLRVNLRSYPDIIDPQKSSFVNEIAHLKLVYEGLTRLNGDLETVPGSAERWEYNEDNTRLTFYLRSGLQYSDGSLLNAMRFEEALMRNINPETAGEYAGITDEIAGAAEWRLADTAEADMAALEAAVGIQALDSSGEPCTDYEQENCLILDIALRQPAPYFHTVMSLWVTFPAKAELIAEGGENWWNSSRYHIGNGPYVLQSLEPFVRGYFVPNANYWGGTTDYDIEFSYITDSAVAFEAYRNNEFDMITLSADDLPVVEADEVLNAEKYIYPGACTYAMYFTSFQEPFTDPDVRAAFAYALDREEWVASIYKGLGSPTLTWIPMGYPGYDPEENRWGYDPDLARETLANSEWVKSGKPLEVVATFGDTPRNRTRWEWLAYKWKEVLDVDIQLNPVEPTTFTALTKERETMPQMFILGWCADYPDPQNWLSVYWMSTSPFAERYGYSNPELDALMQAADVEPDPEKRMALYDEAQKLLTSDAAVAFMWNNVNSFLVKPWVSDMELTPQDSDWPGSNNPLTIDIDPSLIP